MSTDEKRVSLQQAVSPTNAEEAAKVGTLVYVGEQGGNGGGTTYQEASGAPVEASSPLGYNVSWVTIIFLNIGQMIGTGVFSTRQ